MKKKNRSEISLFAVKSETQHKEEDYEPPLDVFNIKVLDLCVSDEDPKPYFLTVTFFNQLLISSIIMPRGQEFKKEWRKAIARGHFTYDPSDYEKMCLFADNPLIIKIHPLKNVETNEPTVFNSTVHSQSTQFKTEIDYAPEADTHCCNIDILPIFIELNKMNLKKRLEPMIEPSVLLAKSWKNLPLITITLKSIKNPANVKHHKMFKNANWMKMTLVGSYNMTIPFDDEYVCTAASKLPLQNETHSGHFSFKNGYKVPRRFNNISFYPQWESMRLEEELFATGDEKFQCKFNEWCNEEHIDLNLYLNKFANPHTILWASFHRTLMPKDTEDWLSNHIRQYKWPIEVHIYGETVGFSYMGFIDLFQLLYPGEKTARLVVPLQWVDATSMLIKCGCNLLLTPSDKVSSIMATTHKANKATTESTSTNTEITHIARPTGNDGNCAFVIVEIALARPIKELVIPPLMTEFEINEMLVEMEVIPTKRECTGRGQLDRDWRNTARYAANSLRHIPYFGTTDLCTIIRQLSETRTRVELVTSFWQDAAIFVNNNFVANDFLQSEDTFEEMLMIAHACLVRISNETLLTSDNRQELSPTLRAARHSRHLQDLPHATYLYFQLVTERPREANSWRELATCLKDVDNDWANVCINKSILLNPRHPLSLLSKGCAVFEEDPDAAEPFFTALLAFYPFYISLWVVSNAYYLYREQFHMAHEIIQLAKKTEAEGLSEEFRFPRAWQHELGDWWDISPVLPGASPYYDAADLLLRVRAISLAEVCIARALSETGESAIYYYMVALCCRLRGHFEDALYHLKYGIDKYGEINYLRSLEGECFHKCESLSASIASLEKAGNYSTPYIVLLSLPCRDRLRTRSRLTDLTRSYPSAHAWMAFANYWMVESTMMSENGEAEATAEQRAAVAKAGTCALNALKCDRRAARAWALLATLLKPSARRQYCKEMAILCSENKLMENPSKHTMESQPFCFRIGKRLRECRCTMCEHLKL